MSRYAVSQTVLVVEDTDTMRKLTCKFLSHAGYQVLEAADGASALYLIHEHNPDLTLLDIHLPDMTGLELAEIIEGYPFMIFTLDPDPELFDAAKKLGALNYFIKPPTNPNFLHNVALAIQQGKTQRNLQKAMQCNRKVAKAIGLLIGNLGFTEQAADQCLRDYATRHRRSLHNLADDLLQVAAECAGDTARMTPQLSQYLKLPHPCTSVRR